MDKSDWFLAFVMAVSIHLAGAYAYIALAPERSVPSGASHAGEGGLEIGLGSMGSYTELTETHADTPAPEPVPDLGQTDTAQEDIPEEASAPEPVVAPPPTVEPHLAKIEPIPVPEPEHIQAEKRAAVEEPPVEAPPPASEATASESTAERPPQPAPEQKSAHTPGTTEAPRTEQRSALQTATRATGRGYSRRFGGKAGDPSSYFSALIAWLNQYKDYPAAVKKRKQQGVVVVAFTIDRSGAVLASSVQHSSGYPLLDRAALDMLDRASPLPAMPESMPQQRLNLAVPVEYSLVTE